MAKLTPEEREALDARLKELDEAMAEIANARKPFDTAISAVYGIKEALLEWHEVNMVSRCEFCSTPIFEGDRGHSHDDGVLCEGCAPTWGDIKKQYEELLENGTLPQEDVDEALGAVQAHIDRGGSLDDKHVWEL